ncbi:MAG: sodium:solute symporter family protein [Ignavibacteriales bacterium]|nr:sodium:solute symporter family protein [Ignavibacteriales bacterium]
MNVVLFGILGYILFQLLLGYFVSRNIRTEDDYLLAGRRLGYGLATFSIFATWFGAESCIGTAGAAYSNGLAGVSADPFGYGVCLILMGLLFAIPLWKMNLTTIADFFRVRFSGSAERITAILMVPTSLLWAAAQIRAFGQVLSASSELSVTIAVTIAAAVVIAYTVSGGMLADAITDVVQGSILVLGLAMLFPIVINDLGGISQAFSTIGKEALSFVPSESQAGGWQGLRIAEAWAIPICGSLIAQELVSRVIASRSPKVARRSSLVAGGMYILVGLIPLSIGLLGAGVAPGLEYPEQILPLMAQRHLTTFLYAVFAGALVSAILSTVDSALLAASGLLSHNILIPLKPGMTDVQKVRLERWGVAVLGLLAYVLALYAEGVYGLVKDASSFGSAGICIVFLFGLFSSFGGKWSAVAALSVGAAVWLVGHYFYDFEFSYLLSLASSLIVYVVFGFVDPRVKKLHDRDVGHLS